MLKLCSKCYQNIIFPQNRLPNVVFWSNSDFLKPFYRYGFVIKLHVHVLPSMYDKNDKQIIVVI